MGFRQRHRGMDLRLMGNWPDAAAHTFARLYLALVATGVRMDPDRDQDSHGSPRVTDSTKLPDDEPMTLTEACKTVFKNAIGPATLRAEARRGRLVIERIGRRDFVTLRAIREMRKKCEVDPSAKGLAYGSSQSEQTLMAASRQRSGSSATDPVSVARAAALLTLEGLSKPSKATSRRSTSLPSATVTPLRS